MPKAKGITAPRAYTYQETHVHYIVPMLQLICNTALWQAEGSSSQKSQAENTSILIGKLDVCILMNSFDLRCGNVIYLVISL